MTTRTTSGWTFFTCRSSSSPVIPGMRWSVRTTATCSAARISSASCPFAATRTRNWFSNDFANTTRFARSSST
jgi:hypothetical protein